MGVNVSCVDGDCVSSGECVECLESIDCNNLIPNDCSIGFWFCSQGNCELDCVEDVVVPVPQVSLIDSIKNLFYTVYVFLIKFFSF